ncbi:glutamine amidotransferase [Kineococcus sp. NPDC059986]|uniref:glutamine amidotransferase n=1 Tax=Kineococcus sp. NPDC059986 TaxID=3155538 RepID=UPI00344FF5F5
MKPFLLLATREDDAVAASEVAAFAREGGLGPGGLEAFRLERDPLPDLDLDDWSGIVLAGSPYCTSDPQDAKSAAQLRVEEELHTLLDEVVARDVPFLGACYGIGTLGVHQGGTVDREHAEPVGTVPVELTADGRRDPVFGALPTVFDAYVGHKEALHATPPGAVLLATSGPCPVQAFRVGRNVYATQFHPELDAEGFVERCGVYRDEGYFAPEEFDALAARLRTTTAPFAPQVWRRFVTRYARP